MNVLPACMYVYMCVSSTCGGQSKMSSPLELELQMVVDCYVGTGCRELSAGHNVASLGRWVSGLRWEDLPVVDDITPSAGDSGLF